MRSGISIVATIQFDLTDELSKRMHKKADAAVEDSALAIMNDWKVRAPKKTGKYSESIHVEHGDNDLQRLVGTNITEPPYPVFLEFGTVKMRPHPSAIPALEAERPRFHARMAAITER